MLRLLSEKDKSESLLAWLAKPAKRISMIPDLVTKMGGRIYVQDDINDRFHEFYTSLYTGVSYQEHWEIVDFLGMLSLLGFTLQEADVFSREITIFENKAGVKIMA